MKNFLFSISKFGVLLALPFIIELFILPIDFFSFRTWEALKVRKFIRKIDGPFYANKEIVKIEEGDLGHHTEYSVRRENLWKTDSLGFRNASYVRNPKVLFIGDSNTVGSSLDQSETLADLFGAKSSLSVYSMAPANLRSYINHYRLRKLEKPDVIVISNIERSLIKLGVIPRSDKKIPQLRYGEIKSSDYFKSAIYELGDRLKKESMKNYIKARINGSKGKGASSKIRPEFMYTKSRTFKPNEENINKVADAIESYRDFCEKEGIRFIYFPIPNKETTYFEYTRFYKTQPDFLEHLHVELVKRDITTINTFKLFNEARDQGEMVYQLDDTHWSAKGVSLVVEELLPLVLNASE